MLKSLYSIIQEVSAATHLSEALRIMVHRVREAVKTEAASIFLIDNRQGEFVMMATDGLNENAIGKSRFPLEQGLIGLVARREEPINLDDAPSHPSFHYDPKVGEEKFRAFLGVPIIHQRHTYGVLIIQQQEQRRFDEEEEAFLVTLSAQLAGVLAHADATGETSKLFAYKRNRHLEIDEPVLRGIPAVPGIGIGTAVVIYPLADLDAVPDKITSSIDEEIELLQIALDHAKRDIQHASDITKKSLPSNVHTLFDVYFKILDKSLGNEVIQEIKKSNLWAQAALRNVIKRHIQQFEAMEDPYLSERAFDFMDIGRRVLSHLQTQQHEVIEYPPKTILVGEEISAAALAEVPEGQLAGLVCTTGSSNAHVAIIARALDIPTVMGAHGSVVSELANKPIIVDGYFGQVYVSPSDKLMQEFQHLENEERQLDDTLENLRDKPAQTPDGHRLNMYVNTGLAGDAGLSLRVGSEGVGLFRTEISFQTRDCFPTEEEQRVVYRQLLKAFAPRPVTMRTLDIGGDKSLPYFPVQENNPYLGWRGIRITLDHPDVFLMQVRAMLRANIKLNNLRILLPMISGVGELDEALHLISQAHYELLEEGVDVSKPPIGAMIEVPSAVYQSPDLAKRVDFLSVGSNDLTQYLLAVDRNNPRVAGLYDSLHPAVLRALLQIVEGGHGEGKHVSICGEMASDPIAVILLLAMGFDSLSMNPTSLLRMKWVIRSFSMAHARKLLSEVLKLDNPTLIRFHLERAIDQVGLGGLIRAGKR